MQSACALDTWALHRPLHKTVVCMELAFCMELVCALDIGFLRGTRKQVVCMEQQLVCTSGPVYIWVLRKGLHKLAPCKGWGCALDISVLHRRVRIFGWVALEKLFSVQRDLKREEMVYSRRHSVLCWRKLVFGMVLAEMIQLFASLHLYDQLVDIRTGDLPSNRGPDSRFYSHYRNDYNRSSFLRVPRIRLPISPVVDKKR